jgi:hypothetical protein
MRAKHYFTTLLLIIPFLAFAQNTGYAGKKFILKTSLLNGRYLGVKSVEAEYVFAKHFSVSVGVRQHKADYKQTLTDRDVNYYIAEYKLIETKYGANRPTLPNATISASTAKAQLKYYTGRFNTKAPRGFYFGLSYETGTAQIDNAVVLDPVLDNTGGFIDFFVNTGYKVKNIKTELFEASLGYQEIFREFICLDIQFALNRTNFNKNGVTDTYLSSTLSAPYYGPNVYALGKNSASNNGTEPYTGSFGLSAYIKLGFLLF